MLHPYRIFNHFSVKNITQACKSRYFSLSKVFPDEMFKHGNLAEQLFKFKFYFFAGHVCKDEERKC